MNKIQLAFEQGSLSQPWERNSYSSKPLATLQRKQEVQLRNTLEEYKHVSSSDY